MADYVSKYTGAEIDEAVGKALKGGSGDGLPTGGAAHQQLVTDVDGKVVWEDRTHYAYTCMAEILPETTVTGEGEIPITVPFSGSLITGSEYAVTYNGDEYTCQAQEFELAGFVCHVLGNLGAATEDGVDTGEPFVIVELSPELVAEFGAYSVLMPLDGVTTATIKILGMTEIVHPLDRKYFGDCLRGQKTIDIYVQDKNNNGTILATTEFLFSAAWAMDEAELQNSMVIHLPGDTPRCAAYAVGKHDVAGFTFIQFSYEYPTDAPNNRREIFHWYGDDYGNSRIGLSHVCGYTPEGSESDRFLQWNGVWWQAVNGEQHSELYKPSKYRIASGTAYDAKQFEFRVSADRTIKLYEHNGSDYELVDSVVKTSDLSSSSTDTTIPTYWLTHLQERVPAIRSTMTAAGWQKSAFFWYHDIHWTYGYQRAPMLLKYLYQHTPINKTIFGGDVVDAEGDDSAMSYLWDWRNAVRDLPRHHSVPGNHDDGNTVDNRFDDRYVYAYLLAAEETPDVVRGDAGLYYYIDDQAERTRYLYLDTATKDGNIIDDMAQQTWLKQTLISTPDGWHIVAIGHIWRTVDYDVTPPADAGWSYGGSHCLEQFDAYNARTGDYASCKGKVEFAIGGHTHVDADFVSDGGIPVILTECDSKYVRSGLDCTEGTITESSVNAIVADYANGIVNVIRIGRGNSRVVKLDGSGSTEGDGGDTPVIPEGDYTNVLAEVGYTENMRVSSSSQAETAATGWDITGYIPAKRSDVIRMANVTFLDLDGGGGATSRAMIYLYDSNKNYMTCSANYDLNTPMSSAWNAVNADNGDIIQFTIPTSYDASLAFIRIGARDITPYSVVTVNEVIE